MPLMTYEPDTAGCATCGRVMGEHPVYETEMDDDRTQVLVCQAFIDPDFDGQDREEDIEPDTFVPCNRAPMCKSGYGHIGPCTDWLERKEPTRSEVHGVSTAGYLPGDSPHEYMIRKRKE